MTRGEAVRGLAERWIGEMAARPGTSFVCSPAGLWLALSAVAAGARGTTADELRAVLGAAGEEAAEAVTAASRELTATDALRVATRVWSRVPVRPEYEAALADVRFGPMDPSGADAWVREATEGLIGRLPLRIDPSTLLVLANVLALRARWEVPFERAGTEDLPFTAADGTSRPVPTMYGEPEPWETWTVGSVRVVELQCRAGEGGGAPARVRLVLGEPGAGAAEVLPAAWAPADRRTAAGAAHVSMTVPRFTLRTHIRVTGQLPALGIREAVSMSADLSGISQEPLTLSQVVQEAVVKVAEEGVEAAAVTVAVTRGGAAPAAPPRRLHIAFDRPFGVVVLDNGGEVPLFTGWQAGIPEEE
ncbi:serpin family protein [Streptomyces sp. NPDC059783]|uniref:serpin family protein n=1 Tax=Streptomyces sp. NPDC059783 TaxID=3346944 RepID=UPI00365FC416